MISLKKQWSYENMLVLTTSFSINYFLIPNTATERLTDSTGKAWFSPLRELRKNETLLLILLLDIVIETKFQLFARVDLNSC